MRRGADTLVARLVVGLLGLAALAVLAPLPSCGDEIAGLAPPSAPSAPAQPGASPVPAVPPSPPPPWAPYDPVATATASIGQVENREAVVPPACYTKTAGVANPCYACHTVGRGTNHLVDYDLQEAYAFSETAMTNHWSNLFVDRRPAMATISDAEALAWIRQDNYGALRAALATATTYDGWRPDLDLHAGVDDAGFARDGSGWRAIRYKPFLGTFFPTNGSSDDVFVRLPVAFRTDEAGEPSRTIAIENLAILERAIATPPGVDAQLPATYVGGARAVPVVRFMYPLGTELLHSVRYVDPDAGHGLSRRLKELRYMRKVELLDDWALARTYEKELNEKDEGRLPVFRGSPTVGLLNAFGWQLTGFIEDAAGRLRVQTEEETLFCMGCHSTVGVTVDQTFSLARKLPGAAGWAWQDLRGQKDVPQAGRATPEILEYFQRVGGADEFRANGEMLGRFWPGGVLDEAQVRRAAPGGDQDLAWLLGPSRERAMALIKAYMLVVREQSYARGRDAVVAPASNVHQALENTATDLAATGRAYGDGQLWLAH